MANIGMFLVALVIFPLTTAAHSTEDTELRDLPKQFVVAWTKHDVHELAKMMADDIDFVNVGAFWLHGKADFEKYHSRLLTGRFKQSSMTPLQTEVRLLRPDLAAVHWGWRIEGDRNFDGSPRQPRFGLMILIAEKRNGRWLVVMAQNTNLMPGKAPEEEGIKPKIEFPEESH